MRRFWLYGRMHEWALAEAVLEELKKHTDPKRNQRIEKLVLGFGTLQAVDRGIFLDGMRSLIPGAGLGAAFEASAIEVRDEPAAFSCRNCGRQWRLDETPGITDEQKEAIHFLPETAHTFLSCPDCGGADFEVVQGRGVTIRSIDIIEEIPDT